MDLCFPSAAVALSVLGGCAHVHNSIFQGLLVVDPSHSLLIELTLKVDIRLREFAQPLLRKAKFLLQRLQIRLALRELSLGGCLILVVRVAQSRKSGLARLANFLELLYMAAGSCQVDLSDL